MALLRTRIGNLVAVSTSAAALSTNPADSTTYVRGIVLHNTSATAIEVAIHWVQPSGGAIGTAAKENRIFDVVLIAKETITLEVPYALLLTAENETVQVIGTAAGVNAFATGDRE